MLRLFTILGISIAIFRMVDREFWGGAALDARDKGQVLAVTFSMR